MALGMHYMLQDWKDCHHDGPIMPVLTWLTRKIMVLFSVRKEA